MKKVFFVFIIAGLLAACAGSTDTKTETTDSTSNTMNADPAKTPDSLKSGPAHGMTPLDTNGRRPRD